MDVYKESLEMHDKYRGKIEVRSKLPELDRAIMNLAYTPGVAAPCLRIHENKDLAYRYTSKRNLVAVVSDGSAVLGLGNIGASAAIPVMEGKALLFREFAGISAFPLCIDSQDVDVIVNTVRLISPVFGGINLEDISAPRCFEIEERLRKELDIPVFHDDQHGTAVVVLAGLLNAIRVSGKNPEGIRIVISGAGAAGTAIAKMLSTQGFRDIIMCDKEGIISREKPGLGGHKLELLGFTNMKNRTGTLRDAITGADVFIGVSAARILTKEMVGSMNARPIVFALANPEPEIMPEDALAAGAFIVATGRSDYPNQINNVLGFPGIFRGALDAGARDISESMKLAAAHAIAALVENPKRESIVPDVFDRRVVERVSKAVREAAGQGRPAGT